MEDASPEKVRELSPTEAELYRLRHSLAHVLAQAVLSLHPEARLGFGPPVDTGFYYDFQLDQPLREEELAKIEKKMREIIKARQEFLREDLSPDEAIARLQSAGQPFKVEFASELRDRGVTAISFYRSGPFVDMCEGPHCRTTGDLPPSFKLDQIAGAYWRGSEKNPMLTRVYGLAFRSQQELDDLLQRRRLAQERDHRRLGRELDLFHIDDLIGRGLPLWLPKGAVIRDEIERFAKEVEFLGGYQRVHTPHITKEELFYRSGHLPYYAEDMYPPMQIDDENRQDSYRLKPMNCPMHHVLYSARKHSYRELPLRLAEYGTVYRYEKSGQLLGLQRVRMLSMNDAHIYLMEEQIQDEIGRLLDLYAHCYRVLGFEDYTLRLSLHDPGNRDKYFYDPPRWERAEGMLAQALDRRGAAYVRGVGEAAFYGPKIDFQFRNVLGKEETISTIQLDFLAAQKFDLVYIGADGHPHPCVVIHRSPLSTHERLVSYLLERYGGVFPTWMAPVQVRLLPVSDEASGYAGEISELLRQRFVRVELDDTADSFGKKIRRGAVEKIPILLILGAKERDSRTVTVRRYQVQAQEERPLEAFIADLLEEIRERRFFKHLAG